MAAFDPQRPVETGNNRPEIEFSSTQLLAKRGQEKQSKLILLRGAHCIKLILGLKNPEEASSQTLIEALISIRKETRSQLETESYCN